MTVNEQAVSSPSRVLRVVLCLLVTSAVFLEYWIYSTAYHRTPDIWTDVLKGTADAPAQYRIGVLFTADWIARHTYPGLHHGLALIDFAAGLVLALTLASLLLRSPLYRLAPPVTKWFSATAVCLLTLNYMLWLTWFIRPETMTNAALTGLTLWLMTVPLLRGSRAGQALAAASMLILSIVGGFVRADLPATLHFGIAIVCLFTAGDGFALPRRLQAGTSVLCGLIATACQYWLMRVRYPHATYGATTPVVLFYNLKNPTTYVVLALALFPWFWLLAAVGARRVRAHGPNLGVLIASVLFFVLWMVVGEAVEVRIFLPYLLALVPFTVTSAMVRFLGATEPPPLR